MTKSQELRQNAENCSELALVAENDPKKKRLKRMAQGWNQLAQTQAWLDGEPDGPISKAT